MRTISRTILYLQMTALVLTAAFAGPTAKGKAIPFRGSMQAVETYVVQPPTLFVNGDGAGNATHLGRFAVTYEAEVNLVTRAAHGSAQFVAANGDSIFTEFVGQGHPIEGTDFSFITETFVITGGTGRFAGASGSFNMERMLNRVTGVTRGSFEGSIVRGNHCD